MIGLYSIVVLLPLAWQHLQLKSFAICDTDANCEAWAESVKLDYRGTID